jgi:hypothetical protein
VLLACAWFWLCVCFWLCACFWLVPGSGFCLVLASTVLLACAWLCQDAANGKTCRPDARMRCEIPGNGGGKDRESNTPIGEKGWRKSTTWFAHVVQGLYMWYKVCTRGTGFVHVVQGLYTWARGLTACCCLCLLTKRGLTLA